MTKLWSYITKLHKHEYWCTSNILERQHRVNNFTLQLEWTEGTVRVCQKPMTREKDLSFLFSEILFHEPFKPESVCGCVEGCEVTLSLVCVQAYKNLSIFSDSQGQTLMIWHKQTLHTFVSVKCGDFP